MNVVEALQNSSPLGSTSTSVKMLAPVVVKPDTLSKSAIGYRIEFTSKKVVGKHAHQTGDDPAKDTDH